jgi:hypothetical protein
MHIQFFLRHDLTMLPRLFLNLQAQVILLAQSLQYLGLHACTTRLYTHYFSNLIIIYFNRWEKRGSMKLQWLITLPYDTDIIHNQVWKILWLHNFTPFQYNYITWPKWEEKSQEWLQCQKLTQFSQSIRRIFWKRNKEEEFPIY